MTDMDDHNHKRSNKLNALSNMKESCSAGENLLYTEESWVKHDESSKEYDNHLTASKEKYYPDKLSSILKSDPKNFCYILHQRTNAHTHSYAWTPA